MVEYAQRNLWLLNALGFLASFRLFDAVLPLFIASITGSYGLAMTGLAVMHFSASFFEIPTGVFSDRIGRRMTMIVYHVSYAAAMIVLYLADTTPLAYLALIIVGFGMAMRTGATTAYVYENLEALNRVDDFKKQEGIRQSTSRIALVMSGLIGTAVIYFFDIRTAVLVSAVILSAAGVLSFWLRDVGIVHKGESNIYAHIAESWRRFREDPMLRNLTLGKIIGVGAGNAEWRFRALLYATIMPEWLVSVVNTLGHVVTAAAYKWAHSLVRVFGSRGVLVKAELFDRVSTAVLTVISTVPSFFAMNIVTSLVYGAREIASEDLLQERYGKKERATMGSIVGLGGSLIYATLGIIMGFTADAIGLINTMLVMQVIMAMAALFYYLGSRPKAEK